MKKYTILLFALLLCLAGCKEGPDYGDKVYITGTLNSSTIRFTVDGQSSMGITVTASNKAENDMDVKLEASSSLVESYNASTGRECQFPPSGSYTLENSTVTIKAGQTQSSQAKLTVDADQLSEGVSYCIPVTITSVSGGDMGVLESCRTTYVLLTKVINIQVAYLSRSASNSFTIDSFMGDNSPVAALGAMTLEMKVYVVSFPTTPNNENGISSLCGCEENFLFRFGNGAGNPVDELELAGGAIGDAADPNSKDSYATQYLISDFPTGRWLHFAAVYDGEYLYIYLDGEQVHFISVSKGGTVNLSTSYNGNSWEDTFAIGRSAGNKRYFDGYVSECRVWNIARTATQLQDGLCYVDPTTDGLVAYWRFDGSDVQDDGSVRDATGHGYDAIPAGTISYVDNQKCPY